MAKAPARIRTKPGKKKRFKAGDDPEQVRRRKSTANRILTILKAALNRAWRDGLTPSDSAWKRVEPFEAVDAARVRFLTLGEATRLINAAAPDFRLLVRGALETGARYGELAALTVADFDGRTIAVMQSKSGRPRRIVLTSDGAKFFKSLTVGRAGTERLFKKADGSPWLPSHQAAPMKAACANAGLTAVNFHALRHAYASLCVMNGISLLIVAGNLGHSSTRMCEKHYAHPHNPTSPKPSRRAHHDLVVSRSSTLRRWSADVAQNVWTAAFPELDGIVDPVYALKVQIAAGENLFNETKDPLRAWEVIALCTRAGIPLPAGVAQYFHSAAIDIQSIAKNDPKAAADRIMKALGFAAARKGKRYVGFKHYRGLENRANACLWVFRQVVERQLPWGKTLTAAEARFGLSPATLRKCMAEAFPTKGKETWPDSRGLLPS